MADLESNFTSRLPAKRQGVPQKAVGANTKAAVAVKYLADTPEIVPVLTEWHHQEWGHLSGACRIETRMSRLKSHLQRLAIPESFVAWSGDSPVGSASLIASDIEALADWSPWLANVFVLPTLRRRGIGSMLVERVAAEAVVLGYPRLYLYTLDQMNFYKRLGWQLSHTRIHRGFEMTVMTRDLIIHPPIKVVPNVTAASR